MCSSDLLIVSDDNKCSLTLNIEYTGSKGSLLTTAADKSWEKFIFLSNNERLEIRPIISSSTETDVGGFSRLTDPTVEYKSSYSLQLTKEQFDMLKNYFSTKEKVQCALYSTDNKVVTMETYNNKWHQNVFTALEACVEKEVPNVIYNNSISTIIIK